MNLWIIGPSKSPQNVEAEHLEELNMKCPTRTSVSRSWNLKVDEVIDMTEILGSFSQPTKHKRCGSTFRLVVAWPRLVFFGGRDGAKLSRKWYSINKTSVQLSFLQDWNLAPNWRFGWAKSLIFSRKKWRKKKHGVVFCQTLKPCPKCLAGWIVTAGW